MPLDVAAVRREFPVLSRTIGGRPLVYLDSANTSQKPQCVIDSMVDHLERHNANISRAMHALGAEATEAFEDARTRIGRFIGAPRREEVVFTKNASEALNLVARVLADSGRIGPDAEVVTASAGGFGHAAIRRRGQPGDRTDNCSANSARRR